MGSEATNPPEMTSQENWTPLTNPAAGEEMEHSGLPESAFSGNASRGSEVQDSPQGTGAPALQPEYGMQRLVTLVRYICDDVADLREVMVRGLRRNMEIQRIRDSQGQSSTWSITHHQVEGNHANPQDQDDTRSQMSQSQRSFMTYEFEDGLVREFERRNGDVRVDPPTPRYTGNSNTPVDSMPPHRNDSQNNHQHHGNWRRGKGRGGYGRGRGNGKGRGRNYRFGPYDTNQTMVQLLELMLNERCDSDYLGYGANWTSDSDPSALFQESSSVNASLGQNEKCSKSIPMIGAEKAFFAEILLQKLKVWFSPSELRIYPLLLVSWVECISQSLAD